MLRHYLKPALGRLWSTKLYSGISIAGLAVALTAALLIVAFLEYESGFDAMHPEAGRTYRLNWLAPGEGARNATFFNPVSPILDEGLEEIESIARLALRRHRVQVAGEEQYLQIAAVDAPFFAFFSYRAVLGDPNASIVDPGTAVLTEAAAQRLFGRREVLGETFTVDGRHAFRVGAVVANNPSDSHLGMNIFVNIERLPQLWNEPQLWSSFGSDRMYHYVRLAEGVEAGSAARVMKQFLLELGFPDAWELVLQPLRDIHFSTDLENELPNVDDLLGTVKPLRARADLLVFGSVAALALLIALLNFTNMQTVQFSRHAREIGVRRLSGSSRSRLVLQLLSETLLIVALALLLALALQELLKPWFAATLGLPVEVLGGLGLSGLAVLGAGALLLGLVAGVWPALNAAALPPAAALRGELLQGLKPMLLRSSLIIIQFTVSIGLIIGSFVVKGQLDYALSKPLGFQPAGVLTLELPDAGARRAYATLRTRIAALPGVQAVSAGTSLPTRSLSDGFALQRAGQEASEAVGTRLVMMDEGYFDLLGMRMLTGRAPSDSFGGDRKPQLSSDRPLAHGAMVLNESAARRAGFADPRAALGALFVEEFQAQGWRNEYTVVGVVEDAHFSSIRRDVEPLTYLFTETYSPTTVLIKLAPAADAAATADAVRQIWSSELPGLPVQLGFLDATWNALYAGEMRTFALFIALSTLAIVIACSGLYGLASYLTERRSKEIGVRKVVGASVWSIVLLFSNNFSRLVLIANVIAWPLAYFAMQRWLENFAYRIDLSPLIFVGSGAIALCIAWVTVGGTAAKAASAKPVLALRYE